MTRKGKRAAITQDNEREIARHAISSKEQRTTLAERLQSLIKWEGQPPEVEVLERKISKFRVENRKANPLDETWCMGSKSEELPLFAGEALPLILKMQTDLRQMRSKPMTIREATWMARLAPIISSTNIIDREMVLYHWAVQYALREKIAFLMESQLDTSDFDEIIISYAEEYSAYPFYFNSLKESEGLLTAGVTIKNLLKIRAYIHYLEQKPQKDEDTLADIELLKDIIQRAEIREKRAMDESDKNEAMTMSRLDSKALESSKYKNVYELLKSIKEAQNEGVN